MNTFIRDTRILLWVLLPSCSTYPKEYTATANDTMDITTMKNAESRSMHRDKDTPGRSPYKERLSV